MSIVKVECGTVMNGYGNCCFFLSLKKGIDQLGLFNDYTLNDFINLSKFWTPEQKGRMVDTSIDSDSIQVLALKLRIGIVIYSEILPNKVNMDSCMVYGTNRVDVVRIVKVLGAPHYNYMYFKELSNAICLNESRAYLSRMEIKRDVYINREQEDLAKQSEENQKRIDKEMEDYYREIEALKLEKQITYVVVEISKLQQDLNGWLESLTCIGRNTHVEIRIKQLFNKYKEYHETLDTLQFELAKF